MWSRRLQAKRIFFCLGPPLLPKREEAAAEPTMMISCVAEFQNVKSSHKNYFVVRSHHQHVQKPPLLVPTTISWALTSPNRLGAFQSSDCSKIAHPGWPATLITSLFFSGTLCSQRFIRASSTTVASADRSKASERSFGDH